MYLCIRPQCKGHKSSILCWGICGSSWCLVWFLVCCDLPALFDLLGPCTNVVLTAYAHVRTEPQCDIGHTREKKPATPFLAVGQAAKNQTHQLGPPQYSNFSCPPVSAWSWFSSPMLVWWVMMLGAHWFVSDPATNLVRIKQSVTSPMHTDCQCECCGKDLVPALISFWNKLKFAPATLRRVCGFVWVRSGAWWV